MNTQDLYERFHFGKKIQRTLIGKNTFTYHNLLSVLEPYLKKGIDVLDIGCGVGTVSFYMASRGLRVVGLDISRNAIEVAKANSKILKLKIDPTFYKSSFLEYRSRRKFDLVIVSEVLEHLRNDFKAVNNIGNLVKRCGYVIASSPSKNAPLFRLGILRKFDERVGHVRRYTEDELTNLFRSNGFEIVSLKKTEGILRNFLFTNKLFGNLLRLIRGPISDWVAFLDSLLIPVFGESQIYVVSRKK